MQEQNVSSLDELHTLLKTEGPDAGPLSVKFFNQLISDISIPTLLQFNKLRFIDLGSNRITDSSCIHFSQYLASSHCTLQVLDLAGNRISDEGLIALSSSLATNTSLRSLFLRYNSISDNGVFHLAQSLYSNNSLAQLNLGANSITDQGAAHLSSVLPHCSLVHLDLFANNLGDAGAVHILNAGKKLVHLNLWSNNLTSDSSAALKHLLSTNTCLRELHLGSNKLGDIGVINISHGLRANTVLKRLDLSSNCVAKEGARALVNALALNRTLVFLNLRSNEIPFHNGCLDIAEAVCNHPSLIALNMSSNLMSSPQCKTVSEVLSRNSRLTHFLCSPAKSSPQKIKKSPNLVKSPITRSPIARSPKRSSRSTLQENKSSPLADSLSLFSKAVSSEQELLSSVRHMTLNIDQKLKSDWGTKRMSPEKESRLGLLQPEPSSIKNDHSEEQQEDLEEPTVVIEEDVEPIPKPRSKPPVYTPMMTTEHVAVSSFSEKESDDDFEIAEPTVSPVQEFKAHSSLADDISSFEPEPIESPHEAVSPTEKYEIKQKPQKPIMVDQTPVELRQKSKSIEVNQKPQKPVMVDQKPQKPVEPKQKSIEVNQNPVETNEIVNDVLLDVPKSTPAQSMSLPPCTTPLPRPKGSFTRAKPKESLLESPCETVKKSGGDRKNLRVTIAEDDQIQEVEANDLHVEEPVSSTSDDYVMIPVDDCDLYELHPQLPSSESLPPVAAAASTPLTPRSKLCHSETAPEEDSVHEDFEAEDDTFEHVSTTGLKVLEQSVRTIQIATLTPDLIASFRLPKTFSLKLVVPHESHKVKVFLEVNPGAVVVTEKKRFGKKGDEICRLKISDEVIGKVVNSSPKFFNLTCLRGKVQVRPTYSKAVAENSLTMSSEDHRFEICKLLSAIQTELFPTRIQPSIPVQSSPPPCSKL
ncbi:hypothetical protein GEMRC1_003047 [Eukaryota sp. GEM-RC1]